MRKATVEEVAGPEGPMPGTDVEDYSYRRDSTGSTLAAFLAGK